MKRDHSSSTLGHDDHKKAQLLKDYMFQRRVLFCCSILMVLSLLIWIIAIATDRWIIISGGGGIFIPETRRFFMSSHSGLWRHCRSTITPNALPTAKVVRNFTSIAYQSPSVIQDAKHNCSHLPFIKEFLEEDVPVPLTTFNESAKRRMFAHWVRNDKEFETFKNAFNVFVMTDDEAREDLTPVDAAIEINPLDVGGIVLQKTFENALQNISLNGTTYLFVIPEPAQLAIFEGWPNYRYVPKLFWPYVRDLGLPGYVTNDDHIILQLVPPKPPKKSSSQANGYDYIANRRCQYIDMFPNKSTLRNDPGFDDEILDYIRTQASFACITIFVMSLGAVFSFYTFMNPRYMFKRLAGGIHLVSASTAVVVIQVLLASVDYTKQNLFYAYPDGAELIYGYGVYFAWFTFSVNLICGLLFIWYSGKKKGSKAPTDEIAMADEPTIMGR